MRTIETTLPWVRVGAGCAPRDWMFGVQMQFYFGGSVSLHFGPLYVWMEVQR